MYYHHFGLSAPPFQFTPTADALYLSREHREALAFLEWSVLHEPSGFAVLAGESGVGKTTLVCSVIARYRGNIEAALVTNPRLSFEQMIALVLAQLGVAARGLDKFEMLQRFMRLLDERAADSCVAIILDEAQELSDEVFGEFRLLFVRDELAEGATTCESVFPSDNRNCWNVLSRPRQLPRPEPAHRRVRDTASDALRQECTNMFDCQLEARGGRSGKVSVTAALSHLIVHSQGNRRRRKRVVPGNAMLAAYGAQRKRVDLASARSAVEDYENRSFQPRQKRDAKRRGNGRWLRPLIVVQAFSAASATSRARTGVRAARLFAAGAIERPADGGGERLGNTICGQLYETGGKYVPAAGRTDSRERGDPRSRSDFRDTDATRRRTTSGAGGGGGAGGNPSWKPSPEAISRRFGSGDPNTRYARGRPRANRQSGDDRASRDRANL